MAHLAVDRGRVTALADKTSTQANLIPRPLSINRAATPRPLYSNLTREDSVALRPVVRCTPNNRNPLGISPHHLTRLACSPHRPKVLRAKGYLFDENILPNMEAIRKRSTPTSSRARARSTSRYSPHTPPNPPVQSGSSNVAIQPAPNRRVAQPATPTPMVPAPPPKDTPDPRVKRVSPLDKELPAKPILREVVSPEHPGLLDATDSAAKRMTIDYPPLEPTTPNAAREELVCNSVGDFKVSPSLRTVRGSGSFEVGTAATKKIQKIQGLSALLPQTKTTRNLRQIPGTYSLSTPRGSASIHRAASLKHVGRYKNGSPMQRNTTVTGPSKTPRKVQIEEVPHRSTKEKVQDRVSDQKLVLEMAVKRGEEKKDGVVDPDMVSKMIEKSEEELKKNDVFDPSLVSKFAEQGGKDKKAIKIFEDVHDDSPEESPARSDGGRRFVKLGVGPAVRFSTDARDVIMGGGPKTTGSNRSISGNYGASNRTNLSGRFPPIPRMSDKEIKTELRAGIPAVPSRLHHATASSAARTTTNSKVKVDSRKAPEVKAHKIKRVSAVKKVTEVKKVPEVKRVSKGIRGQISDLLHGRRRSGNSDEKPTSGQQFTQKRASGPKSAKKAAGPPIVNINKTDIARGVTAREVLVTAAPTDRQTSDHDNHQRQSNTIMAAIPKVIITSEPTNRQTSERDRRQQQSYAVEAAISESHTEAQLYVQQPSRLRLPSRSVDDEPPPPPNNSVEDLRAHYNEYEAALNEEDQRLANGIAIVERSLNTLVAAAQTITVPGFQTVIQPVIRSLGDSVIAARESRVAIINLTLANQHAMASVMFLNESVRQAAIGAVEIVNDIQATPTNAGVVDDEI